MVACFSSGCAPSSPTPIAWRTSTAAFFSCCAIPHSPVEFLRARCCLHGARRGKERDGKRNEGLAKSEAPSSSCPPLPMRYKQRPPCRSIAIANNLSPPAARSAVPQSAIYIAALSNRLRPAFPCRIPRRILRSTERLYISWLLELLVVVARPCCSQRGCRSRSPRNSRYHHLAIAIAGKADHRRRHASPQLVIHGVESSPLVHPPAMHGILHTHCGS